MSAPLTRWERGAYEMAAIAFGEGLSAHEAKRLLATLGQAEQQLQIAVGALARIGALNVHERHLPPAAARDLAVSIAGDAFAEIRALVKRGPE